MDIYKDIKILIDSAEKILILSHRKPDGDTLGAAIALKLWIESADRVAHLACVDEPAKNFSFLPCVDQYIREFDLDGYDLMIVVDAGASYMTDFEKKYPDLFNKIPVLNIDHHASNDNFGTINFVDSDAASTTVMIYRLFEYLRVDIDADIATALLTGIYNDTGSFMHSNTSKEVYSVAAKLMACGAKVGDISTSMFHTKDIATLKLWGRVLEGIYKNNQDIVLSVIKESDYDQTKSGPSQLSGVIDYLNMVPNSTFSVLLTEDRKGKLKASMRTRRSDLDLSKIAANFGGGGHPKASGFTMEGRVEDFEKILSGNQSPHMLDSF